MQDPACCDNNRTSVIFWAPDIYHFVGCIGNGQLETYASNRQFYTGCGKHNILYRGLTD